MRKGLAIGGVVVLVIALLVAVTVFVVTSTDYGRERVRRFVVGQLGDAISGTVRIGSIDGNLLGGVTLRDVAIHDSTGAPFVSAQRISASYLLGDLFRKRIALHDVTIERPVVMLDHPPEGDWNYERIFRLDTISSPDSTLGFGDWISFTDVRVIDGHLTVRIPWEPDDDLTPAGRDSSVADVLGGGSRLLVTRVPGGYQQVMEFQSIHADLPRLRVADPDTSEMLARVASARLRALPFRPPAADIADVHGDVHIADSVYWRGVDVSLPGSRLTNFSGSYAVETGDLWLDVNGEQVALGDLRWLYPPLPSDGGGRLRFAMVMRGDSMDFVAREATLASGASRIAGNFGLAITDSLRFHDTGLRFSDFDTRLIEQLAPAIDLPWHGTLGGQGTLAGTLASLELAADVIFDERTLGRSHVVAGGVIGVGDAFRAERLRVRADPVQVRLVHAFMPEFPIAGTLEGTATVTGSSTRWLVAEADVTHEQDGAVSRLVGNADIALGARRAIDAELRLLPLALATAGRFAPAVGLRGSASGTVTARGPFSAVALAADLRFPDGGALEVAGLADIEAADPGYDIRSRLHLFNANSVVTTGPRTSVTAVARARGRGFDPATMVSDIALDASTSELDSVRIDTLHARVHIADGVADARPVLLVAGSARAEVDGTFGLVADRHGTLTYRVAVDSLRQFSRWIAPDSAAEVAPRPLRQARALAQARRDSARLAQATEVQRAAVGGPPPRLTVDSLAGLRTDSLGGSVVTAGSLSGNVRRFAARGRAAGEGLVALGNSAEALRAEYVVARADTGLPRIVAGAGLTNVQTGGFAFDSADLRATYSGGRGTVLAAIHHERANEYAASAEFELNLDGNVVRYTDLALRFDTTTWTAVRPGQVRWGPAGVTVDALELRSGDAGRIYVSGSIPTDGEIAIDVDVEGLQIAHLVELTQTNIEAQAILSAAGRVSGTRGAPRFAGAAGVTNVVFGGVPAPDVRSTFEYGDGVLRANAIASRLGAVLTTARARIPFRVAFDGSANTTTDGPIEIELIADSLPLDVLPQFTDQISDLRGRLIGKMVVTGTLDSPRAIGAFALDLGSLRIVSSGTFVSDVNGLIRIDGDTVIIDELNGRTRGNGTVQLRGGLNIARLSEPGFDLQIDAEDALLLNNRYGRVYADVGLDVVGPFNRTEIIGGIRILRGVVNIPEPDSRTAISPSDPAVFAVTDTASAFERGILEPESPLMENLVIDVAMFVDRGTFARSIDANIEFHTPEDPLRIRLDQRRDQVDILGAVGTDRGVYNVAGRRFDINRGSVLFIGGGEINPIIQLVGERTVQLVGREALRIRVLIGGTALNPRLTLESSAQPPISQTDLLAYLAFGRPGSSLLQTQGSGLSGQGTASGQLVGDVAALATRQLAAVALGAAVQELQRDFASSLNADVLNITPADVPTELNASGVESLVRGTEIQAGKYFSPQTFASVQVRPATGTILGLRVEQRLPKGYRLEAAFEPRFLLREPSLAEQDPARPVRAIGAFLIWERRF